MRSDGSRLHTPGDVTIIIRLYFRRRINDSIGFRLFPGESPESPESPASMGLPDDSESRSKLYQEELMKLQTSEQKISSTAISLPEGSMFGRVTGRIATITGVDSQQVCCANPQFDKSDR
eukprot:1372364-Amorphochlora_amoeboformis.AAC.1